GCSKFRGESRIRTYEAEAADLQSAPFDRSGISPLSSEDVKRLVSPAFRRVARRSPAHCFYKAFSAPCFPIRMSPLPGSNQRPTDYKSVALPAELRRLINGSAPLFPNVASQPSGIDTSHQAGTSS